MELNYRYQINQTIQNNIIRIEVAKRVLSFLPQLPHIEESLRRRSLLKSSLFSARIEGNSLRLDEVETGQRDTEDREKQEVFNILHALQLIYAEDTSQNVTIEFILTLHKIVMKGLSSQAGHVRTEPSAIFNQAGIAVYMPPPSSQVKTLLEQLIALPYIDKEHGVIQAAFVHFAFEKIHPFLDGNGRVGRLLSTRLLKNAGYDFHGLATFEEYLNEHRDAYYFALSIQGKDITGFIEFFTDAVATSAEKVIQQLQSRKEETLEDTLLPRRQEILAIIREHNLISFDFLKRRFFKVPDSSLHYDLKMLLKKGFIKKIGSTRGALYGPK